MRSTARRRPNGVSLRLDWDTRVLLRFLGASTPQAKRGGLSLCQQRLWEAQLARGPPAVDDLLGAGDTGRRVGAKERDVRRDLVRLEEPLDRGRREHDVAH